MATAPTEIKVTPEIAAEHGLTAGEYARVKEILGREPNITELGIFSVMWSEHCSYKSSKMHLKRLPTRGKLVVQGPAKMPASWISATAWSQRSKSNRIIIRAMSSRSGRDYRCRRNFARYFHDGRAPDRDSRFATVRRNYLGQRHLSEEAHKNRRILDGVVRGVGHYGNCFGVPTVGGEVGFEPCYAQNPLVNALALASLARKIFSGTSQRRRQSRDLRWREDRT